jgi:hypothetical protein
MTAELLSFLDIQRSRVLKFFLQSSLLRRLFCSRAHRLQAMFLLAVLIYLPLALFVPLWVLVIGPILYGIPHILASMRFLHYGISTQRQLKDKKTQFKSFHFLGFIWLLVTGTRLLLDHGLVKMPFNLPEMAALAVTFLGLTLIYRKNLMALLKSALILVPLIFFSWNFPLQTAGTLILAHNFVAFIYWYFAAKSSSEKKVVLFSTGLFLLINALIFYGSFDFLYSYLTPQGSHSWAQLEYSSLGQMIAPWSDSYQLWFHCVVAYAFGQALHYFIWMKAIGDEHAPSEVPTSFRASHRLWQNDLSRTAFIVSGVIVLAGISMWTLTSLPLARSLYFSIAAYHGYLEISALGFLKARA